ncbi:MAG: 16S rRNA (adenine(1518)-N(6)/adenine(1519)-N(6))-dimethyltransferase RsmA [Candidatus Marinimicrobia bacterium]|nr:16S rRNA (adenine(1518)-N(6)/adenine(1519)-N(6))-dimethyltransferase RsmA [Candidatus Neomarinimicrobiota bacterium]MBT3618688.1 16S rRNA (adenine(1518)-N(6)/adenine(1519)-N(6))-dimethyltransferase RsmA [Candidatus Neomarinimicrobiota bacterium]MBT3829489.1 16S rRNA (adenine(1518)-N(6)/adenine(1519)-N(6))-dimethyltransferase RsmA [Candidatus Neomarinimicrobiota bacterium]MBT3997928.1 16S rRNA (adenine(1518)-N(6)/adenine(1519)-N(6))-dimethyltransferase RsmA [Candidatus Neomarinimicrobiota bact
MTSVTGRTQHTFRKKWGQNFLSDPNLVRKIVHAINPKPTDSILEIGPGDGALTRQLVDKVQHLSAVEIDPMLFKQLTEEESLQNVNFVHADILKILVKDVVHEPSLKIVGNIPYNITSPLIFHLLDQQMEWNKTFLMVQKEVADRLAARPGIKAYSRISVMVQSFLNVKKHFTISPKVFFPRPKVQSAIIELSKKPQPIVPEEDFPRFQKIVKAAFSQRRKMLKNTLNSFDFSIEIQEKIDFTRRPETLTIKEFSELAKD